MEYNSDVKKNEMASLTTKWMRLEAAMLSDIRQVEEMPDVFPDL